MRGLPYHQHDVHAFLRGPLPCARRKEDAVAFPHLELGVLGSDGDEHVPQHPRRQRIPARLSRVGSLQQQLRPALGQRVEGRHHAHQLARLVLRDHGGPALRHGHEGGRQLHVLHGRDRLLHVCLGQVCDRQQLLPELPAQRRPVRHPRGPEHDTGAPGQQRARRHRERGRGRRAQGVLVPARHHLRRRRRAGHDRHDPVPVPEAGQPPAAARAERRGLLAAALHRLRKGQAALRRGPDHRRPEALVRGDARLHGLADQGGALPRSLQVGGEQDPLPGRRQGVHGRHRARDWRQQERDAARAADEQPVGQHHGQRRQLIRGGHPGLPVDKCLRPGRERGHADGHAVPPNDVQPGDGRHPAHHDGLVEVPPSPAEVLHLPRGSQRAEAFSAPPGQDALQREPRPGRDRLAVHRLWDLGRGLPG
mmetsp:Transcript_2030/g.4031  ORF Transcript_2030/g.4031 Transcript_2030/m.4031 type:complete len:422 (-) Transcript_2030:239-1504(-)